jgi:hypothetical protein
MSRNLGSDLLRRVAISVVALVVCAAAAPLALASAAGDPTCGMRCCEITRECCCGAAEQEHSDTASLRRPNAARACPAECAQFVGQPSGTEKVVEPAVAVLASERAISPFHTAIPIALATRIVRFGPPRAPPTAFA